jgi:hypothetical protein
MTERLRLAKRLVHEVIDFEHDGHRYTAGIGRFDDGRIAELFLNCGKAGTHVEAVARDAAITASLLPARRIARDSTPCFDEEGRRKRSGAARGRARYLGERKWSGNTVSRRPAVITQADIARVIRAAKQAGAAEVVVKIGDASVTVRLETSAEDNRTPIAYSGDIVL